MKSDNSFLPLSLAFLVVSVLWTGNIVLFVDSHDRGTFGDMFGSVNALFSGMAFSGVVYAIFLQRNELKIAKEELDRTKSILESQSKAIEVQNEAERVRRFESTLFNLVSLYNEIIDDISYGSDRKKDGRLAF